MKGLWLPLLLAVYLLFHVVLGVRGTAEEANSDVARIEKCLKDQKKYAAPGTVKVNWFCR